MNFTIFYTDMRANSLHPHTIARHVGKDATWLQARLAGMTGRKPAAISSFHTLADAERSISMVGPARVQDGDQYMGTANVALCAAAGCDIGVISATGKVQRMSRVKVVLKYETYNNQPYYVLTSFPIP